MADVCSHGGQRPTQPLRTSHPNQTKTITTHFALCFRKFQKITPYLFDFFYAIKTFLADSLCITVPFDVAVNSFWKVMVFWAGSRLTHIFVIFPDLLLAYFGLYDTQLAKCLTKAVLEMC